MFAASKSGRSAAGGGGTTDPYFPYVPLLLETTSTNGQQNNTFLDSGTANGGVGFTITRNGTPTQGSRTPYWPNGQWSNYFNGSTDYLSTPSSSAFYISSGQFTIEAWIYRLSTGNQIIVGQTQNNSSPYDGWLLRVNSSGNITFEASGGVLLTGSSVLPLNTWVHIAAVRVTTSITLYVNGNPVGSGSPGIVNFAGPLVIGQYSFPAAGPYFNGYISNLRFVNGAAVYTTAFTPPTAPLAPVSSTVLLTCQSNRFIDTNTVTTPKTITPNGTPTVQAFQPFSPTASYTTALYGGSGYFNGTSDYLTAGTNAALNPGTGNFTFECWIYATSTPTNLGVFQGNLNGFSIGFNPSSQLAVSQAGVAYLINDSATFTLLNQWVHIVVARSGTTLSLYKNGSRVATTASSTTAFVTSTQTYIASNGSVFFPGYIANLRLINGGTTVYDPTQTTITVPTSPVTATANTVLLLNMTNAGIYDAAAQNNTITVGDAQVSTTQSKWSPTSMKFDGTGDYLDLLNTNPAFNLGSSNWTIELWAYTASTSAGTLLFLQGNSSAYAAVRLQVASNQLAIFMSTTGSSWAISQDPIGSIPLSTWTYVAMTRSGTTFTLYVNGSSVYTSTALGTSALMSGTYNYIGAFSITPFYYFNGYIQDFRITRGVARTIATPTAAFPTR